MTVTVEVNATWRLSRVDFNLAYGMPQSIMGQGEVLLQEAPNPSPEAEILKRPATMGSDQTTYGSMPSATVWRQIDPTLLAETVTVDDVEFSLADVMTALGLFFERWRVEDTYKPTPAAP